MSNKFYDDDSYFKTFSSKKIFSNEEDIFNVKEKNYSMNKYNITDIIDLYKDKDFLEARKEKGTRVGTLVLKEDGKIVLKNNEGNY